MAVDVAEPLDAQFPRAVAAIDAGDVAALVPLIERDPRLVCERLTAPGAWLRERVGDALDGFFKDPYLLWFVAEDPVRNGTLPANIADAAGAIIEAVRRECPATLQEQVDYALRLVCWSWIARECGVQIALIDVLLAAGASVDGRHLNEGRYGTNVDAAIYNKNTGAARHLVDRGAEATLTTALCLHRWDDVDRLAAAADAEELRGAMVQAAMNGDAAAVRKMLALGVPATTASARNQSHGTALHHAVWSGSLETVSALVEAGADLARRDTIHDGTPLGWAEHALQGDAAKAEAYRAIAEYLKSQGA